MPKAYRYRVYPTPEQESLLRRTMGCARLVYNRALAERTQGWYERQEKIDYIKTSAMLTQWKKQEDLQFLNEVSSVPLQQGLRHLQKAFANFGRDTLSILTLRKNIMVAVQSLLSLLLSGRMGKFGLPSVARRCLFVGADSCPKDANPAR